MNVLPRIFAAGLLLSCGFVLSAPVDAAQVTRVRGEPVRATKASPQGWRAENYPQASVARLQYRQISLQKLAELENYNLRHGAKRTQIGVNRAAASDGLTRTLPALRWLAVRGGNVARIEIRSPDALALRVGLQLESLDPRIELRFAGSDDPARVEATIKADKALGLANGQRVFWTPSTDGDTQVIELFAPSGVATKAVHLQVPEVSHLVTNSKNDFQILKRTGASGACNVDVICRVAELGQNFVNAKNAVARMQFVDGGTFTCTGTLLADTVSATQVPYFYTADHCISNQTVASTLSTFWGYEATSCGGSGTAANVQLTGGATYLYSSTSNDGALLRLNSTPPAGAFFAGWDNTTIAGSSAVRGIHHPAGDHKMVSQGQQISNSSTSIEVGWTQGTTEGGSSGSGLFTYDSNGFYLRGGLEGGSASCANTGSLANTSNRDYYSRFDVVYPNISQYLAPTVVAPGPSRNYTGAWYVATESGWGLTLYGFDNAAHTLFGLFFAYDLNGNVRWFQIGGEWTAEDVHSGPVGIATGPAWGTSFNPAQVAFTQNGTYSITFTSASTANLSYTIEGVTRNVALIKM